MVSVEALGVEVVSMETLAVGVVSLEYGVLGKFFLFTRC